MEFNSLTRRAASHFGIEDPDAITADSVVAAAPKADAAAQAPAAAPSSAGGAPGAVMDRARLTRPIDHEAYETVTTLARLSEWIARAREAGLVAVDTETTSLDPMQAGLCGVSLAVAPGEACYIPCGHRSGGDLVSSSRDAIVQMAEADLIAALKPLLEDPAC